MRYGTKASDFYKTIDDDMVWDLSSAQTRSYRHDILNKLETIHLDLNKCMHTSFNTPAEERETLGRSIYAQAREIRNLTKKIIIEFSPEHTETLKKPSSTTVSIPPWTIDIA